MPADSSIYDRIWQSDGNRLSIGVRDPHGAWTDAEADILLDHQTKASGNRTTDAATKPLFHYVNEERLNRVPTVPLYKALLDNYLVGYRDPEDYTEAERAEDETFLEAAMATEPMRLAKEYITNALGKSFGRGEFLDRVWKIWFEPFTNYYGGRPRDFASGFEHIFVGEGTWGGNGTPQRGEVKGYHDWIKFYLDEAYGRVDFRGTQYNLRGQPEPKSPTVVTLQMVWNLMNTGGEVVAELFKRQGGFFVGISPECLLALGTVGFFESTQGIYSGDRRRVTINGESMDLVVYRETRQDGRRGEHLISFFAEYLGSSGSAPSHPGDPTVVRPVGCVTSNSGPVVVTSAMVNPPGDDTTGEWVEIENATHEAIDLTGWRLADKLGRALPLAGQFGAGERKRVSLDRSLPNSMMLGNGGGRIVLIDSSGAPVATVCYGRVRESETVEFQRTEAPDTGCSGEA